MKTKNKELNVDFIGGMGSLTESEEKALIDFFKKKKSPSPKKVVRTTLIKKTKEHA